MTTIPYTRDDSDAPPRLALFLNMGTLDRLPDWSTAPPSAPPSATDDDRYTAIRAAGFTGVQFGDPTHARTAEAARDAGLACALSGRVDTPQDADTLAQKANDQGAVAVTCHVLRGLEDDAAVDPVIDAILNASAKHDVPVYVETHRSTCTQDIWRTVQIARRFPGLKFNGDFSHWYTGLEMVYMGVDTAIDFAAPVLDRVGFLHGRIGNSGSMQVDIGPDADDAKSRDYVQHFLAIWGRVFTGFKQQAQPGDYLVFAPELLKPEINYARTFPDAHGQLREECDRWQQALLYADLAREAFDRA